MANIIIKDPFWNSINPVEVVPSPEEAQRMSTRIQMQSLEAESNCAVTQIDVSSPPEGEPYLVINRKISRKYKPEDEPFGSGGELFQGDVIPLNTSGVVVEDVVNTKVGLTSPSYQDRIPGFGAETDIHSEKQVVLLTERAATLLEETGYSVNGIREDVAAMESVPLKPGQEDAVISAEECKKEYRRLYRELQSLEAEIEQELRKSGVAGSDIEDAGLGKINFRKLPDSAKLQFIPVQYQARWQELKGRLQELWKVIHSATTEVIDENYREMTIPESVTASAEDVAERNLDTVLHSDNDDGNDYLEEFFISEGW